VPLLSTQIIFEEHNSAISTYPNDGINVNNDDITDIYNDNNDFNEIVAVNIRIARPFDAFQGLKLPCFDDFRPQKLSKHVSRGEKESRRFCFISGA
jgi:hypothetical protein